MTDSVLFILSVIATLTLLTVGTVYGAAQMMRHACEDRWADYQPTYAYPAGCMITFEGQRIPADRVWFEPKN